MKSTRANFLESWMLDTIRIDRDAKVRLTGEDSLCEAYEEAYEEACKKVDLEPLTVQQFSKDLDVLLVLHHRMDGTKGRDSKGTFFRGITVL